MKHKKLFSYAALTAVLFSVGLHGPTRAADDITVEVNGRTIAFDQAPVMENDRVLVPVRALAEALGARVGWNGASEQVTSVKGTDMITLQIGSKTMWKNLKRTQLDVAPKLVGSRTLVPVRAVSEGYDAQVEWNGQAHKVIVNTNTNTNTPAPPAEKPEGGQPEAPQSSYAYRVFELTNQERVKAGLTPFEWNDSLASVAYAHSKDMSDRNFFDHTNPDGLSPFDRMKNAGLRYSRAAENIAAGQRSPEAVVNGWMNSSGHRANILNPQLTQLGVGYYEGGGRTYWTQCFRTP